jgi:replicative DNA helicase
LESKLNYSGADSMNLPYNLDAEQAVLGCILIESSCLADVQPYLRPECFYLPQHEAIYSAMISIDLLGGKIDPLLVLEKLKNDSVYDDAAGKTYLYQLASSIASVANVTVYAKIVREKFYLRTLINISREIIDSAVSQEEDADVILDAAEQEIYAIRQGKTTSAPSKLSDIIYNEVLDRLTKLNSDQRDEYLGLSTGFGDLDDVIVGLNKSDLILVGARPAMGKTSFALNIARNVAVSGKKRVLFFSLEMTKEQIAQRVLSTDAGVNSKKMREGKLDLSDWIAISEASDALNKCELYFDDTSDITVSEMKARTRRLGKVDCVFIDYLGLVRSGKKSENRVQEVTEITRSLKLMAKDLAIPVFVCAQLSRGTEHRGKSHRPQLSDMRESGSIEQDADLVILLYREDYYKGENEDADTDEEQNEVQSTDIEVIVAKNRHGETKTVKFVWDAGHTRFIGKELTRNG